MSLTAEDEVVIGRFREVRAAAQALDRELLKVLVDVEGKPEPIRAQEVGEHRVGAPKREGLRLQTAFFAGYSSDSLLDVFLDRFEQLATKQGKLLAGDTGK